MLDQIIGSSSNGSGYQAAKGKAVAKVAPKPKQRRMPAAAKAKLAAIARARWAKVKAAGKKKL